MSNVNTKTPLGSGPTDLKEQRAVSDAIMKERHAMFDAQAKDNHMKYERPQFAVVTHGGEEFRASIERMFPDYVPPYLRRSKEQDEREAQVQQARPATQGTEAQ